MKSWTDELSTLKALDEETRAQFMRAAARVTLPPQKVLFRPGDACVQFPLVVSGSILVRRITESGREIVLYRVAANETCILTTASLLAPEAYTAEAVTESVVEAYVLKAAGFYDLMNRSESFRNLVFAGYSRRIAALMSKIEDLICMRVDARLAERLLELMNANQRVSSTQHALAADLGTAREVVGRVLNAFERSGWVRLSRGAVDIIDARALGALIASK